MFNIRWSAIAGGCAFILSLLLGLISGAGLFALLRAGIFGALFFLLGSGIHSLINIFLPDMLEQPPQDGPGARVDISVEGEEGFPSVGGVDGLSDLVGGVSSSALDQGEETGYTNEKYAVPGSPPQPGVSGVESAIPIDGLDSIDTLPDLEGIGAFQPLAVEETMEGPNGSPPPERNPSVNSARPAELDGDFKPQEIAQAIQTILKRE